MNGSRLAETVSIKVDAVLGDAQLRRDDLADLDVEALRRARRVEQAEQGLVELGADGDGAGLVELGHRRAGLERGVGLDGRAVVAAVLVLVAGVAGAAGQHGAGRGHRGQRREGAGDAHGSVLSWVSRVLSGAGSSRGSPWPGPTSGLVKKVSGVGLLDDPAVGHEDDPVGGAAGEAHLVGDDDHRHAVVGQRGHDVEDLVDHLGVERGGRLVEEHHLRVHGQRAGDRHPLLLAAGQLRGHLSAWAPTPTRSSSSRARFSASALRLPADLDRPEGHVLEHGLVREQVEGLEDHPDVGAQPGQALPSSGSGWPSMVIVAATRSSRGG